MNDPATQRQALADKIRNEHRHVVRRRRLTATVLIVLGVLALVTVTVWLQLQPTEDELSIREPANATSNFGFTLTPELATDTENFEGEPIPIAIYEDFLCSSCKIFHEQSGGFLAEQVDAGKISVTYHPFTFMLTQSTNEYSQRASNAAVCVADQAGVKAYVAMHSLLLTHQPAMGTPGLTDDELIEFAGDAGAHDVAACVQDRAFSAWVEAAMEAGLKADVSSTPTVRVNGLTVVRSDNGVESIPGPDEIQFAIEATQ